MTGLDLETFLSLPRFDPAALGLLLVLPLLAVGLVWWAWGTRRAVQRCLVFSLVVHLGLAALGSSSSVLRWSLGISDRDRREHLRQIRIQPARELSGEVASASGRGEGAFASVDRVSAWVELADRIERVRAQPVGPVEPEELVSDPPAAPPLPARAAPVRGVEAASGGRPEERVLVQEAGLAHAGPIQWERELDATELAGSKPGSRGTGAEGARSGAKVQMPGNRRLRIERGAGGSGLGVLAGSSADVGSSSEGRESPPGAGERPLELAKVTPHAAELLGPESDHALERRPAPVVPRMYRPRLGADRSAAALRLGASDASEHSVEQALAWLARHQDEDGRWDSGVAHYDDGTAAPGDDSFTVHCPAGDVCSGECAYWEADTGLTGLALLAFLGAGHTHRAGPQAAVVRRGIEFLLRIQRADGDLRGPSRAVGMYCHCMATLALCEAYALSGDERLRGPVERAIRFLVQARAADGMAWRYRPGEPVGDTSILGWVVLCLKAAREVGAAIPDEAGARAGALRWLELVSAGSQGGLACYQPGERPTPTMTAEAWVCRLFLGQPRGGPGDQEASAYLLAHDSDRGPTNVYYWYYATLALYQHGGPAWERWNASVRDRLVRLQRTSGHAAGSWDPDGSLYGKRCGRVYCTALAALTLEVYYRYQRLDDEPRTLDREAAAPALNRD